MSEMPSNEPEVQKNGHLNPSLRPSGDNDPLSAANETGSAQSEIARQPARSSSASSLHDRVRQGADAFQFDALLDGVSTMHKEVAVVKRVVQIQNRPPATRSPKRAWFIAGGVALVAIIAAALAFQAKNTGSAQGDSSAGQSKTAQGLTFPAAPIKGEVVLYSGRVAPGWGDWSWAKRNLRSTRVPFNGQPVIEMDPTHWEGIALRHNPFSTKGISSLVFSVNGGRSGGQQIWVRAADRGWVFGQERVNIGNRVPGGRIPARQWVQVTIPLDQILPNKPAIGGIVFQAAGKNPQDTIYFADIKLTTTSAATK